ncbi:MAG: N-formylglutamate amidohydrolase [Sphingomicrobium sp.]
MDEPPPVAVHNAGASSPFLLVGDHAGNRIPSSLLQLGLDEVETSRHIAWDIGVAKLGECLADRIGASFIRQVYSRLVIDCNRRPGAPDSIPAVSDGTAVPGNSALDNVAAGLRAEAFHQPYQAAIAAELDRRSELGLTTTLVALHSFTPSMGGFERPWHAGILYDGGDNRFARATLDALAEDPALIVGDNEPYAMNTIDFTIPFHAYPRVLPYVEIEIRQDLLSDSSGIAAWCARLERVLNAAQARYRELPA